MKAKTIRGKSSEEIRSALAESMADDRPPARTTQSGGDGDDPVGRGFKPTVAIVFISIKQDRKAICEILHQQGIDILGATSCGEFIQGYQDVGTTVIMLLDLSREAYSIIFSDFGDGDVNDAATRLAQTALERFRRPAFILCSTGVSENTALLDGEALVRSIEKIVGPDVNIYGGMAGDDGELTGTYVFTYEKETNEGIAALVLDEDKISLHGMAISGWKPIGIFRTVTKSERNRIYTIDDQPALDMYFKYLGKEPASLENKYKLFDEIGLHYPFQVEREKGEPLMRTPMAFDIEDNALVCDFDVPQGSKLRFSLPPDFDIVEKVLEEATGLKNAGDAKADALLIFSCAGRYSALGPLTNAENDGLGEIWKAPMAGFFTYGEYGRTINGNHEFHSTTCCWVAIDEK